MRELLTSLPAVVAYLSGPGLVVDFINDACSRLIGGRDVLGKPLGEAVPELADEVETLNRVMATGEPVRGSEARLRFNRGGQAEQHLFLDYVYQPVRDADGNITGILLCATDVTAHVQARRELEATAARLTATEEQLRGVFETMPQGVIHYAADRTVLGVNPAARQILGLAEPEITWPLDTLRRAVHEDGSPVPTEELPVSKALRTGEMVSDVMLGVPHGQTDEIRWLRVTAVPEARDEEGRPQRAYAMFTDLTQQRRVEAALRKSTALLGRLREANALGVIVSSEQRIHDANDAFLDLIGYSRDDLEAGRLSYQSITPPEYARGDAAAVAQLRRTGVVPALEKEYVHRDGHRVPVLIGGAVIDPDPLRWVTFIVDLTARQRAERERAELLVRERATKAEADRARERLAFLLHAGEMVAATDDRQQMLEHAAHLVVPALADHCVVYLPAADGTLHATSLAHSDPARAPVLAEFRQHKIPPAGPMSIQVAYSTGTSQLLRGAKAQLPRWHDLAPDLAELLVRLRADSVLSTPLLVDERPVGVLALARDAERPGFTDTDIAVVEEFARRLAARAGHRGHVRPRAHHRRDPAARRPARHPAQHQPAGPGRVLPARHRGRRRRGRLVRRLPARRQPGRAGDRRRDRATASARRRSWARYGACSAPTRSTTPTPARCWRGPTPPWPGCCPRRSPPPCTPFSTRPPASWSYANAGHLPPLVATGAGQVDYLDEAPARMLGASPDAAFTTGRRRLARREHLLYYTDGLIENAAAAISPTAWTRWPASCGGRPPSRRADLRRRTGRPARHGRQRRRRVPARRPAPGLTVQTVGSSGQDGYVPARRPYRPGHACRARGRERARRQRHIPAGGPAERLRRAHPRLVHRGVQRADPGPGPGLGGHRRWRQHPGRRADRIGQDAGRLPVGTGPAGQRPGAGRPEAALPGALHLPAQGAGGGHRAEPARPADRDPPGGAAARAARTRHRRRGPHRRHGGGRAPPPGQQAAGHPYHHPGVAVPHPDLPGPRRPARRGHGHRGRGARTRGKQAGRAPGALAGTPRRAAGRCRGGSRRRGRGRPRRAVSPHRGRPADRAVGDRAPPRGGSRVPGRVPAGHDRRPAEQQAA